MLKYDWCFLAVLPFNFASKLGVVSHRDVVYISHVFLDHFLHQFRIIPDASYLCTVDHDEDAFAIFDVVLELTYVDPSISVFFLGMFVNNAIFKDPSNFCSIGQFIAPISSHIWIFELTGVFVTIVESHYAFAIHVTVGETALVDAIVIVKNSAAVHLTISVLTFVFEVAASPAIFSFSIEKTILKLTCVYIAICFRQSAPTMDNIRCHLSFVHCVNSFFTISRERLIPCRLKPGQLAVAMHLRIDKITDVVSSIKPLEFAKALDLRIYQITSVNIVDCLFHRTTRLSWEWYFGHTTPFFIAFAINLTSNEVPSQLYPTLFQLFHTFTSNLILIPLADIFSPIYLFVLTRAME